MTGAILTAIEMLIVMVITVMTAITYTEPQHYKSDYRNYIKHQQLVVTFADADKDDGDGIGFSCSIS